MAAPDSTDWNRHHILSLADFAPQEYDIILQTANSFREVLSRPMKKVPALQGQVVTNLFFEPSTRTRSSFELAAKRLSADTLNFAPGTSSLTKGETILDTAKTYLAMGTNLMVIRHREAGVPQAIAQEMDRLQTNVRVLNAGDGQHEHPSQALLDLFTLCTLLDPEQPRSELLKGKKVAIVGDILHSRVARSNIWSLTTSGAEVHLAAPPTLLPREFGAFCEREKREDERQKAEGRRQRTEGRRQKAEGNEIQNPKSKIQNSPIHPSTHPPTPDSWLLTPDSFPPAPALFLHHTLAPALQDADFVMTLRLQHERMTQHLLPSLREYHQQFGITRDRLQLCKPTVKVLHPGPTNRGVEITSDVMDDPALSLISQQVTSGVAIRMALLYLMGTGGE
ncbi:MAG: aspartate carbamoyltransferase catalytic subunit [Synechococcales bacterium]|nr:aspartate carbamoyltransferase catalytic subunit [Synechococcales bacterium]